MKNKSMRNVRHASQEEKTNLFIEKARDVHGELYDYSRVVYEKWCNKVEIICKDHGEFWQSPNNHLKGRKCPTCQGRRRRTRDNFIEDANNIHGGQYSYHKSAYKDYSTKLIITCPLHGDFKKDPRAHLSGAGCPRCSGVTQMDTKAFVQRARDKHGDAYDYKDVQYVTMKTKVDIWCRKHDHKFQQTPDAHLRSVFNCDICRVENRKGLYHPNSMWGINGFYKTNDNISNIYLLSVNEEFLKLGLSKDIRNRITTLKCKLPKEVKETVDLVSFVTGPARDLFYLEQGILYCSTIERIKPAYEFEGESECIRIEDKGKVLHIFEMAEKHYLQDEEEK